MRWYAIRIFGAPRQFPPAAGASIPGAQWDSWINDKNDPGAQEVEMMIEPVNYTARGADSSVIIKGVSWDQINQTANLIGCRVEVFGGMHPGLPLATFQARPPLPGLLIQGVIVKSWGNWEGTDMELAFTIGLAGDATASGDSGTASGGASAPPSGGGSAAPQMSMQQARNVRYDRTGPRSISQRASATANDGSGIVRRIPGDLGGNIPGIVGGVLTSGLGSTSNVQIPGLFSGPGGLQAPSNLIHNMMPGQSLSSAIQQTLSTAFPEARVTVAVSPMLKLGYQDAGVYQNLEQYAGYIKDLSQSILGANNYHGIRTTAMGNTIRVFDGTIPITEGQVATADLIGQPTWVDQLNVHVKTVMRSDLQVGDVLTLPPTLMRVESEANVMGSSIQRTNLSFNGKFRIQYVQHIGDFRSPNSTDWSSNFRCSWASGDASTAFVDQAASALRAAAVQAQMGGQQPIQTPQGEQHDIQPQSRLMRRGVRRF